MFELIGGCEGGFFDSANDFFRMAVEGLGSYGPNRLYSSFNLGLLLFFESS